MEYFAISQQENAIHVDGVPDAVKLISLIGPQAKRLSDLALHRSDLTFADECLDNINSIPAQSYVVREALWRSAIVHFAKCFGESARFQLSAPKILKHEPPEAMAAFTYFKHLRNKHFIHDENSYAQSIPGAAINDGTKSYKVEKIVCLSTVAGTSTQENFSNLKLLLQRSRDWVDGEFDGLCNTLTAELEHVPYANLLAKDPVVLQVPKGSDIGKRRVAP